MRDPRDRNAQGDVGDVLDMSSRKAVEWFMRLRSPDVSRADLQAQAEWLAASSENRNAYEEVAREWERLDGLADWANTEIGQLDNRSAARMRRRGVIRGAAAATAMALILALILWPTPGSVPQELPSLRYETVKAEQRQVVLEDGSRVHLNTASAVEVSFSRDVREVRLVRGETLFDVEHDSIRPFVVRADQYSVIALGTRFAVRHTGRQEVEVTVLEGRVTVRREQGSTLPSPSPGGGGEAPVTGEGLSVIVRPGQQVQLAASRLMDLPVNVNVEKETAWLRGNLAFEATPLREVVDEMSRYMPGSVRVAPDVPDHPVTGIIQIRNPDRMLKLLSQVVPVIPVKESAGVIILHQES